MELPIRDGHLARKNERDRSRAQAEQDQNAAEELERASDTHLRHQGRGGSRGVRDTPEPAQEQFAPYLEEKQTRHPTEQGVRDLLESAEFHRCLLKLASGFGEHNTLTSGICCSRHEGETMNLLKNALVAGLACCAGLLAVSTLTATPCNAGSIPAWLDDGISQWNKQNAASPIKFVDIKDSYVWYTMAGSPTLDAKEIRGRAYGIAYKNGYVNTQDEEIVTTGRPPSTDGPSKTKKCWTRSFLRDVQKGSSTTVERMLTTLVCEDGPNWSLGFRTLQ
jgi:hypothetical protein